MRLEDRPEGAPGSLGGSLRFLLFALLILALVLAGGLVLGLIEIPALREAAWRGAAVVGLLALAAVLLALLLRLGRR